MVPYRTLNIRCRILIGIHKGTIILTTTHMVQGLGFRGLIQHYVRVLEKNMGTILLRKVEDCGLGLTDSRVGDVGFRVWAQRSGLRA